MARRSNFIVASFLARLVRSQSRIWLAAALVSPKREVVETLCQQGFRPILNASEPKANTSASTLTRSRKKPLSPRAHTSSRAPRACAPSADHKEEPASRAAPRRRTRRRRPPCRTGRTRGPRARRPSPRARRGRPSHAERAAAGHRNTGAVRARASSKEHTRTPAGGRDGGASRGPTPGPGRNQLGTSVPDALYKSVAQRRDRPPSDARTPASSMTTPTSTLCRAA